MDERVFRALKVAAARENRTIGALLEEAAGEYVARRKFSPGKSGLRKFIESPPFKVPDDVFRAVMDSDPYDQ